VQDVTKLEVEHVSSIMAPVFVASAFFATAPPSVQVKSDANAFALQRFDILWLVTYIDDVGGPIEVTSLAAPSPRVRQQKPASEGDFEAGWRSRVQRRYGQRRTFAASTLGLQ
jgi:hypothetical protein